MINCLYNIYYKNGKIISCYFSYFVLHNYIYITNNNIGDNVIDNYEIKKIDDEEVLCLYIDINNEFAKINFKKNINNIENSIREYIKKNRIAFTGTTVALIAGTTLIGNINLKNNNVYHNDINNKVAIVENYSEENQIEDNPIEPVIEDITSDIEEINNQNNEIIAPNNDITSNDNESLLYNINNPNSYEQTPVDNSYVEDSTSNTSDENITIDISHEQEVDNNIYVTLKRSNNEIMTLELEEYITGVVGAEMPASFNIEALKAQAVIARTYALKNLQKGNILTDNAGNQYYKNNSELENIWGSNFNTYYAKVKKATEDTKGEYLSYNGNYIEAVYHSTSNGKTESSTNVWGNYYPYLISVDSLYDNLNKSFEMTKEITYQELSNKLGIEINNDTDIEILSKTESGRVKEIKVDDIIYRGIDFRNILALRSADFTFEKTDEGIIFTTLGYGHGVGLSQYGANGLAKNGYSYYDILYHYYPGTSLENL